MGMHSLARQQRDPQVTISVLCHNIRSNQDGFRTNLKIEVVPHWFSLITIIHGKMDKCMERSLRGKATIHSLLPNESEV